MILKGAGLKPSCAFTEQGFRPQSHAGRKPTAEPGVGETPHQRARDRRSTDPGRVRGPGGV